MEQSLQQNKPQVLDQVLDQGGAYFPRSDSLQHLSEGPMRAIDASILEAGITSVPQKSLKTLSGGTPKFPRALRRKKQLHVKGVSDKR